jgi:hypothetical protein
MISKLSKSIYLSIPPGDFLASNVMRSRSEPIFAEVVASSQPDRELQWGRIVSVGANQRKFHVFRTQKDYKAWLATFALPQNTK